MSAVSKVYLSEVFSNGPDPLTLAPYNSQLDNGELTQAGLVAIGVSVPLMEA